MTISQRTAPARPETSSLSGRAGLLQWLALLAIIGVVVYVAIDVLLQLLPPHYNPLRVAESDYVNGPYGWLMTLNFLVRGAFSLALLIGLSLATASASRSTAGLVLLGIWGVGSALLALFPADLYDARLTRTGKTHLLIALISFAAIAFAEPLLARPFARDARWRAYAPVAFALAVLTLIGACLLALPPLFFPHFAARVGGLTERVFLGAAILWIVVAAFQLLRLARKNMST